jgi:uncharacterized protein (DUF1501 family)
MGKTTRRDFIKGSGFTLITVGLSREAFSRHLNMAATSALTEAAALSTNDNILIVIQLEGGNDGLNTVIPTSGLLYSLYRDYRKRLAIPDTQIWPIGADAAGNQLGLHPSLQPVKSLYDQGHLAVIQSVGYPHPNRSHFRSMDIWHTANPDRVETTGWLGDYLDVAYPSSDNPLIAVSIGGKLPLSLRAHNTAVPAIDDVGGYQLWTDGNFPGDNKNKIQTLLALNRVSAPERVLYEHVRQTMMDVYNSTQAVRAGVRNYTPAPGIVYNEANDLATAMRQVAQLIAGNLGTKIFYVSLDGFDTHTRQKDNHAALLGHLADAVDTFYRDLQRLGRDDKVLIMTWSEFGRKVKENDNIGTDHGASAPQFVFGASVKGGVYGEHPSLTDLYGEDDTKHSIDFRSYYATVLEKWLGVDSHEVLGGLFELLDFVRQ